eukprot:TRINITY_DN11808_c0_g1_i1.p1 TRINITY_DN11808_c0_g1~~TRINITY_DN11808_c0_g1_i1.p1  ORF type:complete len:436 (+),score=70.11 TRINITY_DN11808_c0_g1_i1:65-1372(+)
MKGVTLLILSFLFLVYTAAIPKYYYSVNIDGLGFSSLQTLKNSTTGLDWWLELGEELLLQGESRTSASLLAQGLSFEQLGQVSPSDRLYVARKMCKPLVGDLLSSSEVLLQRHGFLVFKSSQAFTSNNTSTHFGLWEFQPNVELVKQAKNLPIASFSLPSDPISNLVNLVDDVRWFNDVKTLSTFNRYSLGTGIKSAENWIISQIKTINPKIEVSTQQFTVKSTAAFNIIAKITGTQRPNEWYVVGAHYDSISEKSTTSAPGAEDNGSGTAGVLEMLRIFTANPPAATVFFILYSGEEQGLYGSAAHAKSLVSAGTRSQLKFAMIMDMVGFVQGTTVKALVETYSQYKPFVDLYLQTATEYVPNLQMYTSYSPFGSDHMSYLTNNMPSVLAIDADYDKYPAYHKTTDLPNLVVPAMAKAILKLNVAVLAKLLLQN